MFHADIMFGGVKEKFTSHTHFAEKQRDQLESAFERVRQNARFQQRHQKYYFDGKILPSVYKTQYTIGDWVRVYSPSTKLGYV